MSLAPAQFGAAGVCAAAADVMNVASTNTNGFMDVQFATSSSQERKVDGTGHRLVSRIVQVQVIHGLVLRQHLQRMDRIAHRHVEIDDAVVGFARANPFVHGLPACVLVGRIIRRERREAGAFERQQRAADDLQAARVRTLDQLAEPGDQFSRRGQRRSAQAAGPAQAEIVDPFEHDDVRDAALHQRLTVEPRKRARTDALREHAIAGDADVQHARHGGLGGLAAPGAGRLGHQPPGKVIGPAVVGIRRRQRAVGNRIAECDDGANRFRGRYLDARQEEPRLHRACDLQVGRARVVAGRRHVAGLQRATVGCQRRRRRGGVARQEDVDREVRERRHRHADRIADRDGAGRDGCRRAAAEGERPRRGRNDRRVLLAQRDVGGADRQGSRAEHVAEHHADAVAAEARVDDLPQGLPVEVEHRRAGRRRRCRGLRPRHDGCRPRADPVIRRPYGLRARGRAGGEGTQRKRRRGDFESLHGWPASPATLILSLPRGDGEGDVQFVFDLDDAPDGDGRDAVVGLLDDELAGGRQPIAGDFDRNGRGDRLRLAMNRQPPRDRQVERGRRSLRRDPRALEGDRRVAAHIEHHVAQHRRRHLGHVGRRFALAGDAHRRRVELEPHIVVGRVVRVEMDDAACQRSLDLVRVAGEAERAALADVDQGTALFGVHREGARRGCADGMSPGQRDRQRRRREERPHNRRIVRYTDVRWPASRD